MPRYLAKVLQGRALYPGAYTLGDHEPSCHHRLPRCAHMDNPLSLDHPRFKGGVPAFVLYEILCAVHSVGTGLDLSC
jgi:hypothetical protein